MNMEGVGMNMFIGVSIANFACAVVTYIVLGGYKLRRSAGEAAAVKEHFTKESDHQPGGITDHGGYGSWIFL